jgi:hypothetical protein
LPGLKIAVYIADISHGACRHINWVEFPASISILIKILLDASYKRK